VKDTVALVEYCITVTVLQTKIQSPGKTKQNVFTK